MPNRILKESICESRSLSRCSTFAEDLYKRLITYADDYGRFNADTQIMLARLYARDMQSISEDDVIDGLVELVGEGKIQFYTAKPRHDVYGCFPNWAEHQRVRDSKKRCPDPSDTSVNDWYLRRFISIDMKAEIISRAKFKCEICGKFLTTCEDARRFAKLGSGLFHIDHIVPCNQGGRATLENLRLTCPRCNLSRKRRFSFEEIVDFSSDGQDEKTCGDLPQLAATRGDLPPESESNPNPNPNPIEREKRARFTPPTPDEVRAYCQEKGYAVDADHFCDFYASKGWRVGNQPMKDWRAAVRTWATRDERGGNHAGGNRPVHVSGATGEAGASVYNLPHKVL